MSAPAPLDRLADLRREIDGLSGVWGAYGLNRATARALAEPSPGGSAQAVAEVAGDYATAARHLDTALLVVEKVRREALPAVWAGRTHVAAGEALDAVAGNVRRAVDAVQAIGARLRRLADAIAAADGTDGPGASLLRQANELTEAITAGFVPDPLHYDGDTMRRAHQLATDGIAARVGAHTGMRDAGRAAAEELHDLAGQARLYRLADSPLSTLDEVVIANAGASADGPVLSAVAADRAADAMLAMTPADRQAVAGMLASAGSPEHRAYLLKAVAAGYAVADVARFNRLIAARGADPAWLREHLSPVDLTGPDRPGRQTPSDTDGAAWAQGPHPTCVAASTVTARAQVDPLYALELTTGGRPDDPGYDNPRAFADRLRDEQVRVYDGGRDWLQDLLGRDGMTDEQSRDVANEEIAPRTGAHYGNRDIDDPADRRAVLGDIARAVDEGHPVPFTTRDGDGAHQLLIVGHDGDLLQVYNPWGYTVWVSEDDFVHGRMDRIDPGVPQVPASVRLPGER